MRAIKAIFIEICFLLSGIYGTFGGVKWAWNIFAFLFWAQVVIATLVICSEDAKAEIRKVPKVIPGPISYIADFAVAVGLAAFGHFAMAGFWLWSMLCEAITRTEPKATVETKGNP